MAARAVAGRRAGAGEWAFATLALELSTAGVRREFLAAGETGTRCRAIESTRHSAAAPQRWASAGRPSCHCRRPCSAARREGGRSSLASPETGLLPARVLPGARGRRRSATRAGVAPDAGGAGHRRAMAPVPSAVSRSRSRSEPITAVRGYAAPAELACAPSHPLHAACRDGAASRTPPALPAGPRQWPKAFRPSAVAGLLAVAAATGLRRRGAAAGTPEVRDPRPGRRHRLARSAVGARPARRRHRGSAPTTSPAPERRACRAAAAAARRRDRPERRPGVGLRRVPARTNRARCWC